MGRPSDAKRFATRSRALAGAGWILAAILCTGPGCAAYRFGNETLYASDVQTVYVPMIPSESFRRELGERLTEAIVKEIEIKTPFKVVGTPDADSILAVRLVNDTKRVVVENQFDDPRAIETSMYADVTWHNRRREPLRDPMAVPLPAEILAIGQSAALIPESGQSLVTQQQLAIQRLARQIVSTMEEPW
jgi:hypothetical protein